MADLVLRSKDLLMVNYDGYGLMAQTNLDALVRWPHLFNRTVEVKVRYLVKRIQVTFQVGGLFSGRQFTVTSINLSW